MSVEQGLTEGFDCSALNLRRLDHRTGPVDVSTTVTGGMVKVVEIVLAKVSQLLLSYSEALQNISKWLKRMPWTLLLTSSHPSANLDLGVSTEVFVRHLCHLPMESLSSLWTKCHLDVDPDLLAVLSSVDHNGLNAGGASDRRSSTSDWQSSLIGLACLIQVVGQIVVTPRGAFRMSAIGSSDPVIRLSASLYLAESGKFRTWPSMSWPPSPIHARLVHRSRRSQGPAPRAGCGECRRGKRFSSSSQTATRLSILDLSSLKLSLMRLKTRLILIRLILAP